jgi:hypothetical protein
MSDEPKPTSERARKRAAGKILREALIKRREAYFELLVAGYSIEQIASHMKKSPSAIRRAVAQALANRRLDAPEDYARLQVARLTKALRCADVSLEMGDLKAIAPFLKVVSSQAPEIIRARKLCAIRPNRQKSSSEAGGRSRYFVANAASRSRAPLAPAASPRA